MTGRVGPGHPGRLLPPVDWTTKQAMRDGMFWAVRVRASYYDGLTNTRAPDRCCRAPLTVGAAYRSLREVVA
ncbi:hypothetical protein GCM10027199_64780 [Amycolatopsis magusensis]